MEQNVERPKVRLVKGGENRLKSGVIRVESEDGQYYRGPCDRCTDMVTTRKPPLEKGELICRECRPLARQAKPTTKIKRKRGKTLFYLTDCDLCGDEQKTPFMPKKGREFLCDECFKVIKKEEQASQPDAPEQVEPSLETSNDKQSGPAPAEASAEEHRERPQEERRTHFVNCRRCKKQVTLKFRWDRDEVFLCRTCYENDLEGKRKERPDTRLIFKLECVDCGKSETVDFVPKHLSEPICTTCFNARKRRR